MREILIVILPWPYLGQVPEATGLKLHRVFFDMCVDSFLLCLCVLLVARDSSRIQKRMHVV